MKKIFNSSGMTLFIAVTIMGILLFISFAVMNIVLKGTLFATSGRDSQFAFYASDAGLECANYWDSKYIASWNGTNPVYGSAFNILISGSPINCTGSSISNGQAISGTTTAVTTRIGGGGVSNRTSVFGFVMNQGSNPVQYCAIVTVRKNIDDTTTVNSRGYNTCDTSNPRRIERGIEVTY